MPDMIYICVLLKSHALFGGLRELWRAGGGQDHGSRAWTMGEHGVDEEP